MKREKQRDKLTQCDSNIIYIFSLFMVSICFALFFLLLLFPSNKNDSYMYSNSIVWFDGGWVVVISQSNDMIWLIWKRVPFVKEDDGESKHERAARKLTANQGVAAFTIEKYYLEFNALEMQMMILSSCFQHTYTHTDMQTFQPSSLSITTNKSILFSYFLLFIFTSLGFRKTFWISNWLNEYFLLYRFLFGKLWFIHLGANKLIRAKRKWNCSAPNTRAVNVHYSTDNIKWQ